MTSPSLLIISLLCFSLSSIPPHPGRPRLHLQAAGATDALPLVPGRPVERELSGAEAHPYQVTLAAGQYLRLIVDQRGADLIATLNRPDGRELGRFDSRWQGPEPVSWVAEAAGTYRLTVRALRPSAARLPYAVRLEVARAPLPEDHSRLAAERATAEGKLLIEQRAGASLRAAREKYEAALPLWQAAGDRGGEAQTLNSLGYLCHELGEPRKALDFYQKAVPLRQAAGDLSGEGETLHNLAAAYSSLGEKGRAVASYEQALRVRRGSGTGSGRPFRSPTWAPSTSQQGRC